MTANGQPAMATHLRRPSSPTYEALTVDVLRIEDGLIAEITTFGGDVFRGFALPRELDARTIPNTGAR